MVVYQEVLLRAKSSMLRKGEVLIVVVNSVVVGKGVGSYIEMLKEKDLQSYGLRYLVSETK
jgi:hypothetical protein